MVQYTRSLAYICMKFGEVYRGALNIHLSFCREYGILIK